MYHSKRLVNYFKLATLLLALFFGGMLRAQNITVRGTVTDQNGEPVIGAGVVIKGTTRGTATDALGNYNLTNVPTDAILSVTCVNYEDVEVRVNKRTTINVVMDESSIMLDEAVITAEFGLKRVARAVGSAVQNVKASDIQESGRESFITALQGRVAGIQVTPTGGAPGASTTVVLRNVTSISGSNQPLYVIDGVPMNNSTFNPVSGFATEDYSDRYYDFSSRGNDLNPEDIESMTVLKGAAAAALYGSDASNGAIVITTKKGSAGRGKVTYSTNLTWSQAYGYPEMQTTYANGQYGITNYYYQSYWGGKYPSDGSVKLYDNVKAILQTGFSQTHNLAVEGGTDKVTVRGSASYLDQTGTIKTTDYTRLNISLSGKAEVTKWLNFDANLSYSETTNTKAMKGTAGPLYRAMKWPMVDDMSNWLDDDGLQMRLPFLYTDTDLLNPLYALYKNKNYDETKRIITTVGLNVTPTKHTFLTARLGWDYSAAKYEILTHPYYANREGSSYGEGGAVNISKNNLSDKSLNILAGYNNTFGKFTVSGQVGYHQQENGTDRMAVYGTKFAVIDFYGIANCDPSTVTAKTRHSTRRIQAISMSAEVGYNDMAFLTFRARNDWSSTLPVENNSYFYPAIEGSFIMTELPFLRNNDYVTYLKLRGAIARVGKDASPLSVDPSLEATEDNGGGFRYGYTGPNHSLKPEMTTSYEIGFEGRFLNDRINMDFTYFWTRCDDQYITDFRLSYATGFVLNDMNVGTFKTWGWEYHIDADIIKSPSGWRWNVGLNLSHSDSEVTELPENVSEYYNAYTWNSGNLRNGIKVGYPVTAMTGLDFKRNDAGQVLISPSTGLPEVSDEWSYLGDRNPKIIFGISSSLSWKQFRLSLLFSGRLGATVVNGTKRDMMSSGTSEESVKLRESGGVIFEGVLDNGLENTSNPTPNNIVVDYTIYSTTYTGADANWLEDHVNYMRLSEIRFQYTLPSNWLKSATRGLVSSASVWVSGTDLVTLTNYSGIDAVGNMNSASMGGSGGTGCDLWGSPTPRGVSIGANITF